MVALDFAHKHLHEKPNHNPVLFCSLYKNDHYVPGFQMNSEAYSAYPYEDEMLI